MIPSEWGVGLPTPLYCIIGNMITKYVHQMLLKINATSSWLTKMNVSKTVEYNCFGDIFLPSNYLLKFAYVINNTLVFIVIRKKPCDEKLLKENRALKRS